MKSEAGVGVGDYLITYPKTSPIVTRAIPNRLIINSDFDKSFLLAQNFVKTDLSPVLLIYMNNEMTNKANPTISKKIQVLKTFTYLQIK